MTVTRQAEGADGVAVNLSATPNPAAEGSPVTVTATLAEAIDEAVTVPLTTTRGTSEEGDHGSLTSIELPAGSTSATGTITTSTDTDEDDETFTVALDTLPSGLAAGTASSVEVTITDSGQQRAVPVTLSALTASTSTDGSTFEGTLDLGTFAAETTAYTATVAHAVSHVKLTPTASAAGTTVEVGKGSSLPAVASGATSAAIALAVGANALEVKVSADGRAKTYTVTVTREARVLSADATLSALSVEAGTARSWSTLDVGTFTGATTAYTAKVPYGTTHARLTATPSHAGATLKAGAASSLAAVASETATAAIALAVGANALAVEVTAENGAKTTYAVAVTREAAPPLTAEFENVPAEHTGEPFTLDLVLSDTPAAATSPAPASFKVSPGTASVTGSGTRYTVTVTPKPANAWKDVTVTLLKPADCTVAGAICTADGRALSNSPSRTITGPVRIRVDGARAREGRDESLDFAVTLHRAAPHEVSVDYATKDGESGPGKLEPATAGADYTAVSGTLVFAPGETAKTVSVPVIDDAIDEGKEVMYLLLSHPKGAYLRGIHTRARGIITNDDVLQKAWLARFGILAGAHLTDAVSDRLGAELAPGAHATLSGQSLDLSRTDDAKAFADVVAGFAQRFGESGGPASNDDDPFARYRPGGGRGSPAGAASSPGQSMTARELLLGSSFHVAGPGDGSGPELAAWGRVAHGGFEGEEPSDAGRLAIEGEVLTGTLGADADWGRMLAGVAVSLSEGDGTFDDDGATTGAKGKIESSMTTLSPYLRFKLTERVSVWGLAGLGTGDMAIGFDDGTQGVKTDISMRMGAVGARGELLQQDEWGGFDLALKSDAFFVRMESEKAPNSAATTADGSRVRLVLEGGRAFTLSETATLRPSLELGLRHDGGDAETGAGLELGGGIAFGDAATGFSLEAKTRVLVAHADSDYEE